jgi:hypothetical protein
MDKRTKQYRTLHRWFNRYTRASAVAGFIVGSLITLAYIDAVRKQPVKELLSPLSEVQGMEVTPTPTPTPISWNDAIRQVFPQDEAGRMIRICLKEHQGWRGDPRYALNDKNKNGSYDYGPCQVNSIHKPKGMTHSNWKTYLEDPMNHAKEVRRIFLSQWWFAWSVYTKGLVK